MNTVANTPYRFSHNDSNESAKSCIKRMNSSQQISREAFNAITDKDEVARLEASLGRKAHAFYLATDDNGEAIAYMDIHAIHYIFKVDAGGEAIH